MAKRRRNKPVTKGQTPKEKGSVPPSRDSTAVSVAAAKKKKQKKNGAAKGNTMLSLASRLKKERGKAETTPLPSEWSFPVGSASKSVLTPSDDGFEDCRKHSYKGLCWDDAESFDFHEAFRASFHRLHEHGLFAKDAVQPGKRKLTYTRCSRTLVGKPGSTYRYLGLRLFSHPWTGPLQDWGYTDVTVRDGLLELGRLNGVLKRRTEKALAKELPDRELVGSADFNLTLINRMDPLVKQRNGSSDRSNGNTARMPTTSVNWHKDSGLMDFSSIAVYHLLEDPTKVKDSEKEEEEEDDDDEEDVDGPFSRKRFQPWSVGLRVANAKTTPQLSIPLPSGAVYYLLDDFNHQHEHAVMSGSGCVRYSSTHRVAREGQGTWQYLRDKCEMVMEKTMARQVGVNGKPIALFVLPVKKLLSLTKSQQQLATEIEFEWLRQWYVQGRRHAEHHPYWHQPMAFLEETLRTLQRFETESIEMIEAKANRLWENRKRRRSRQTKKDTREGSTNIKDAKDDTHELDSVRVSEDVMDTLIENTEARKKLATVWEERLRDPLYASMSAANKPIEYPDCIRTADRVGVTIRRLRDAKRQIFASAQTARSGEDDDDDDTTSMRKKDKTDQTVATATKDKKKKQKHKKKKGPKDDVSKRDGGLTKKEKRKVASNWEALRKKQRRS